MPRVRGYYDGYETITDNEVSIIAGSGVFIKMDKKIISIRDIEIIKNKFFEAIKEIKEDN